MLVVWKLDQELAWGGRITKWETRIVSWRNLRVAIRADNRLGALKKLRPMTADARVVARKVGNVRKVSYFFPVVGGNFVAGIAGALVLFGAVRKP